VFGVQKNLKGQNPNDINKARVLAQITWVGVPLGTKMLSYKDGLIPQETVYKLESTIHIRYLLQVMEFPD
jgi:hypothetical protein